MAAGREESPGPHSERLLEVARELVSELDLEAVLARVLDAARELTDSRYAALGILDEHKAELERFLYRGIDEETRRSLGSLPRGHGILGELIRRPQPVRIASIGDHPHSYGFPPGHPPMTTFLGAPIVIGGEAWGNLYLTDKAGGREFDQADEDLVVLLAQWASVAIDNARLHQELLRRRVELERAVRGLEANVTIARAVAGETQPQRVLELVAKRCRALLEARTLMVLLVEGDELVVSAIAGEAGPELGVRLPLENSPLAELLRSERSERISDTSSRARAVVESLSIPPSAALLVPIVYRARARGVLAAFDRSGERGGKFSSDDELVATSFAAAAATAIFTARTVESEKLQRSLEATEHERRRWARELHDETLQELGGLSVTLETASAQPGEEALRGAIGRALEHTQRGIEGVRALINELRPPALDELGLRAALEVLVERAKAATDLDLDCTFETAAAGSVDARLAPELEIAVYRLVQEAVNNAIKHAGASRVEISVADGDGVLRTRIGDDGAGFDPAQADGGFGLTGMRERAALLGGRVLIDSAPGRGTVVEAELPLASALDQVVVEREAD
ncbi:MAG TPA: GAF domain-containing protein [Solirubrobacterales bacterium]